jgi:hypothetical protein
MTTKFYIAGIEIKQPEGVNGLYMERVRDKIFGGFIRKKTSSIKGVGSIKITDLEVCSILKSEFEANKINGKTDFKIVQNDEVIYEAEVDYNNFSENHNGHISISFRDTKGIVEFDANLDKEYEIEPTGSITLDKTELTGKATHTIDTQNVVSRGRINGSPFLFSIPLKVNAKDSVTNGIGLDVKAVEGSEYPFWQNSGNNLVKIKVGGYLSFNVSSSSTDHVKIVLVNRVSSKDVERITLFEFDSNTVEIKREVIIDKVVSVGVGGDVCLSVIGSESIQGYNYTFQTADMAISQDLEIDNSEINGLLASRLLSELIKNVGGGNLTFVDEAFTDIHPFITNGLCLRQNKSNIKTSFTKLFSGLSKIYSLILTIENNIVYLRKKKENYKISGAFPLSEIDAVTIGKVLKTSISGMFYSEVKAGYSEWKSDTLLGNLEYNSTRIYDTEFKTSKSSLDLMVNEMVASGKIIEKQRRMKYDFLKSNEKTDDKNDNTLFIIDSNGSRSILGANGINESINPIKIIENHELEIGHCKELLYRTGEGNVTIEVLEQKQNKDFLGMNQYFTGMQVMINGSCDLLSYMSFDDKVTVDFRGETIEVWIEEDLYRLQTNTFNIKGLEIAK